MPTLVRKGVLVVQLAEDPLGVGNPHFYRKRMRLLADGLRSGGMQVGQATLAAASALYGCSYDG